MKRRHIPKYIKWHVCRTYAETRGLLSIAAIARIYNVSRQSAHQWINGESLSNSGRPLKETQS